MAQVTHLLDTHAVIWALEDSEQLKSKARGIISRAVWGELAISDLTLFELAMLISKKRVLPDLSLRDALRQTEEEFVVLPLDARAVELAVTLALPHGDPFDRGIVATAIVAGIPLLTADRKIRESGLIETLW